jgi:hypothetical protein
VPPTHAAADPDPDSDAPTSPLTPDDGDSSYEPDIASPVDVDDDDSALAEEADEATDDVQVAEEADVVPPITDVNVVTNEDDLRPDIYAVLDSQERTDETKTDYEFDPDDMLTDIAWGDFDDDEDVDDDTAISIDELDESAELRASPDPDGLRAMSVDGWETDAARYLRSLSLQLMFRSCRYDEVPTGSTLPWVVLG